MKGSIKEIIRFIRENESFTVISHISPDGDTLGSALGLASILRGLGKEAETVCSDHVPMVYAFLPGVDCVKLPEQAAGYPAVITVDCSDKLRLGDSAALFDRTAHTACVDHHSTNAGFAQADWVEITAATGELIWRIASEMGAAITKEAAVCLFTAIMTDTGCFAYSNVTKETMSIAGELIRLGANNAQINRLIYHTVPLAKARMHAYAMSNMRLYHGGKITAASLTEQEISSFGGLDEHTEGLAEQLRDIDTSEIAIFLKQKGNDVKVSLRAKETADVSRIAAAKNGGGHARAAGYTEYGCGVEEAERIAVKLGEEELIRCWKA